jgi:hypothetical protein
MSVKSLISKWESKGTEKTVSLGVPLVMFNDTETEFPELMTIGMNPMKNIITREMRKNTLLLDTTKPIVFWVFVDKPEKKIVNLPLLSDIAGPYDYDNKALLGFVWAPLQLTSCKKEWYSTIIYYTDNENYRAIRNSCSSWTFCFDLCSKKIDNVYHVTCLQCELD